MSSWLGEAPGPKFTVSMVMCLTSAIMPLPNARLNDCRNGINIRRHVVNWCHFWTGASSYLNFGAKALTKSNVVSAFWSIYLQKPLRQSHLALFSALCLPPRTARHWGHDTPYPSGGSRGMRGMRPHPPQFGQKIFERLYFGHCGETADQIRMPFGIIGRTGSGMRQDLGIGPREGVLSGANLGCAIVTSGDFTAYVYIFAANYFGLVITGNGDDAANDFNKYKMLRNL